MRFTKTGSRARKGMFANTPLFTFTDPRNDTGELLQKKNWLALVIELVAKSGLIQRLKRFAF
jgi:hypothetical protein